MQKPVALVFALLLAFGAIAVVPMVGAAPAVTDVSPSSDDTNGGKDITITGTEFGTTAGSVSFGTKTANIISWTDTVIHAVAPATGSANVTDVNVIVRDANGIATTFGN